MISLVCRVLFCLLCFVFCCCSNYNLSGLVLLGLFHFVLSGYYYCMFCCVVFPCMVCFVLFVPCACVVSFRVVFV